MNKPGLIHGWIDWRVPVMLALVLALLLALVIVDGAGARSPGAFSGRAEVSQRLPRGWRQVRPLQSGTVRGSISLPNRAPARGAR